MKETINALEYAGQICKALPGGVLLTTASEGTVNTMTIGWGHIGIEWGKPIFVAYIRASRHTKDMLDQNGEFTVNIPYGDVDKQILGFCGTKSGRDVDKIAHVGLTLESPEKISVPGIKELPLTLECKVIYTCKQEPAAIPQDIQDRFYPADEAGEQDYHIAYYGEIVDAYLIR